MNKLLYLPVLLLALFSGGCYSFKDVAPLPAEVKTIKINYIDNKARYVNPLLSPQLTDKLRQKVLSQIGRTQIQGDNADYEISGYISDYSLSTTGISNKQAASNRLNVSVHIIFKNRLDEKKNFEADITRNFDFIATLSLQQAEAQLNETIVKNLTDEIFNRIFSNW